MKIIMQLGLLGCLIFVASCDKNTSHFSLHEKNHSHAPQSYQKPGANIRLSHNYDGKTAVAETENIRLTFTEQYSSGSMYVRLKPDTALTIEPTTKSFEFSMDDGATHSLDLAVTANTAGKHLLNIFASVMDERGQKKNRVMAVAFYVGDSNHRHSKSQAPSSTEKVIILPSQESGN